MPKGSFSGLCLIGSGESAIVVLDLTTGTVRYRLLLLFMEPLSIYLSAFTLPGVGVDILLFISWRSFEGSLTTFTGSDECFSMIFLSVSFDVVVVVDGCISTGASFFF